MMPNAQFGLCVMLVAAGAMGLAERDMRENQASPGQFSVEINNQYSRSSRGA